MKKISCLLICLSFLSIPSIAQADDIEILIGDLPTMAAADGRGRNLEIIKAVMEKCGHKVSFTIQPFTRHWESYQSGQADAVADVPEGMAMEGAASKVYLHLQNGVSFLKSSGADYNGLEDLAGKKVIAFMGADGILPSLKEQKGSFAQYREVTDQMTQNKTLFGKRIDAVIGDGMLFAEYTHLLQKQSNLRLDPNQPVTFKAIFPPSPYVVVFRNSSHTGDFNRCFDELSENGTIEKINMSWASKYREILGEDYVAN